MSVRRFLVRLAVAGRPVLGLQRHQPRQQGGARVPIVDGIETARLLQRRDSVTEIADGSVIRAVGVRLPGPVDIITGYVEFPSRMPGWPGFGVGEALTERFGVPVAVDNDANLAALGEHVIR